MNPEDSSRVSSVRSNFLSEAWGEACVLDGQRGLADPLFAMEGGDRLLGGGDQVFLIQRFVVRLFAAFSGDLRKLKYSIL